MTFSLPDLPYPKHALEPHVSAETLEYHHGKHHAAYVKKLNGLIEKSSLAGSTLDEIVRRADGDLFNNAAQHWNHSFYWQCLSPDGGGDPAGALHDKLVAAFDDVDRFRTAFAEAATGIFGSGWAWLVQTKDGSLAIRQTANAENPLVRGETPLLTCDMWEHAFYIDHRNARERYVDAFWHVVDWDHVARQL